MPVGPVPPPGEFSNTLAPTLWRFAGRHLKHTHRSLGLVILVSLGDRVLRVLPDGSGQSLGSQTYSPFQLKIIQEVVTLVVFIAFAFLYFGQKPQWNHIAAFLCILGAVAFTFLPGK